MEAGMRAVVVAVVVGVVFPGVALAQLAPASQAEFEQRFTGWTLLSDAPDCNEGNGIDPVTFIGPGRFETNGLVEFLYSLHRLNVATSRARCVAVIVASPALLTPDCSTPQQMRLANPFCRFLELAAPAPAHARRN